MKPNYLWVLEMKNEKQWLPTCWVALSKEDMKQVLKDFHYSNPDDIVRVRKYEVKP